MFPMAQKSLTIAQETSELQSQNVARFYGSRCITIGQWSYRPAPGIKNYWT